MSHHPDGNNSRIRHVPINVERRDDANKDDARHGGQHHGQDGRSFQERTLPAQFRDSPRDTRSSRNANTSHIDINYQSPYQQSKQQYQQQEPSDGSFRSPDQTRGGRSVPMDSAQSEVRANQDKENSDRETTNDDSTCANNSRDSPTVIPLPPPPEQPKTQKIDKNSSKQSQNPHQQQEGSQQKPETQQEKPGEDEKKLKKPIGPVDIMNAIQNEVDILLKEIVACNETSQDSKEYRRLDEFLTRCVLKLDNIECSGAPDLRTQRKAIIARIDRCTDVLKRKISLNHDIQQLVATIPQK